MKRSHKYQRCQKCRELVLDAANCAVCANANPLSLTKRGDVGRYKAPSITLDQVEGNAEEYFGGLDFPVKGWRA